MKWFDNFINRPIVKILRLDKEEEYEPYQPYAIFLMFDTIAGLLVSIINDGNSIQIGAANLTEVYEDYGIEFNETILNELKLDDELNMFVGQSIKKIKVGIYDSDEIKGDTFIMKQGKYAGVIIVTDKNKFTFYNDLGRHLYIDDEIQFPNSKRWTLT